MQSPVELVFRNVEATETIKALIAEKIARLEAIYDGITSCHIHIRAPHQSQRQGNLHQVTIELRVPGDELVVRYDQDDASAHQHLRVMLRRAFAAMERDLKRWKDRVKGEVKAHDGLLQGKVVEIHPERDFGQIIATDQRVIYFHRNSVVDGSFDTLAPRDTVELVVQSDESAIGPQASTVRRIAPMAFDPAPKPSRR